jgi:hypothetical protein
MFDMAAPVEAWVPSKKLFHRDVAKVFRKEILEGNVVMFGADDGHLARSR